MHHILRLWEQAEPRTGRWEWGELTSISAYKSGIIATVDIGELAILEATDRVIAIGQKPGVVTASRMMVAIAGKTMIAVIVRNLFRMVTRRWCKTFSVFLSLLVSI
jgi:hypothetical protein